VAEGDQMLDDLPAAVPGVGDHTVESLDLTVEEHDGTPAAQPPELVRRQANDGKRLPY
jgi:hypothetical protein